MIDVDKISVIMGDGVLLDGVWVGPLSDDNIELIKRAYINIHKSHMYGENLKKIRWVKGEN
jgi:hypothetical protein